MKVGDNIMQPLRIVGSYLLTRFTIYRLAACKLATT